jgi:RNA-directed DNA polymerase
MNAMERSDSSKVVKKQANKATLAAAELVERRDGAKENADLQTTVRTQSREAVSQAQGRIRVAVTRNRKEKLTALLHHIDTNTLRASFLGLKKSAAPGVDEMSWSEYAENLENNLADLCRRITFSHDPPLFWLVLPNTLGRIKRQTANPTALLF